MSYQAVVIGSGPGDGTGDTVKQAFTKSNANFSELYSGQWAPASFLASKFIVDSGSINTISAGSYTLQATDNGKLLVFTNNGSTVTLTIGAGLPSGFSFTIFQKGTSPVQLSMTGGTTLHHPAGHTKTAGQYGVASLYSYSTDVFLLTGATAA